MFSHINLEGSTSDLYDYIDGKNFEDSLCCTLCCLPLVEPVTGHCSHSYCKSCLERWRQTENTCPKDNKELGLFFPNYAAANAANKLRVRCRNRSQGCQWEGARDTYDAHRQRCDFQGVECPYECKTPNIVKRDMEFHESKCPHRHLLCDCGVQMRVIDYETHKMVDCAKYQIACDMCGIRLLRGDFNHHIQEECPERMIPCSNSNLGCTNTTLRKNEHLHKSTCPFEPMKGFMNKTIATLESHQREISEQAKIIKKLLKKIDKLKKSNKRKVENTDTDSDSSSDDEKKKKKKKKLKTKDPNKPKRAMSSFLYFANEKRPSLRMINPNLPISEIGRQLGLLWKALSVEERKRYEDMAQRDQDRYRKDMSIYKPAPNGQPQIPAMAIPITDATLALNSSSDEASESDSNN